MSEPTRYRLDVQGKNYLVAMVADKEGDYIDYRNYAALQAENERLKLVSTKAEVELLQAQFKRDIYNKALAENELLRKAGDLFIGTYLFASVKGLVTQDEAVKVLEEWHAAKGGQS
jgi:predicted ATPase